MLTLLWLGQPPRAVMYDAMMICASGRVLRVRPMPPAASLQPGSESSVRVTRRRSILLQPAGSSGG